MPRVFTNSWPDPRRIAVDIKFSENGCRAGRNAGSGPETVACIQLRSGAFLSVSYRACDITGSFRENSLLKIC